MLGVFYPHPDACIRNPDSIAGLRVNCGILFCCVAVHRWQMEYIDHRAIHGVRRWANEYNDVSRWRPLSQQHLEWQRLGSNHTSTCRCPLKKALNQYQRLMAKLVKSRCYFGVQNDDHLHSTVYQEHFGFMLRTPKMLVYFYQLKVTLFLHFQETHKASEFVIKSRWE